MSTNIGAVLQSGSTMYDGDYLTSPGGFYTLTLGSGELFLKDQHGNAVAAMGNGANFPNATCTMQNSGNLAIVGSHGPPDCYDSGTGAYPGAKLILSDLGHAQIFTTHAKSVWDNGKRQ